MNYQIMQLQNPIINACNKIKAWFMPTGAVEFVEMDIALDAIGGSMFLY